MAHKTLKDLRYEVEFALLVLDDAAATCDRAKAAMFTATDKPAAYQTFTAAKEAFTAAYYAYVAARNAVGNFNS